MAAFAPTFSQNAQANSQFAFSMTTDPNHPPLDPLEHAQIQDQLRRRENEIRNAQFLGAILGKMPEPRRDTQTPETTAVIRRKRDEVIAACKRFVQKQDDIGGPGIDTKLDDHVRTFQLLRAFYFFQTHSINELPAEILSNIFRYVCWATNNPDTGVQYRLRLTKVCTRWREAALADSTLWSAIWFKDPPPHKQSLLWLDRAGTASLDIRINDGNWSGVAEGPHFTGDQMSALLDKLFVKISKIRILVVVVQDWPPALVVLDKMRQAGLAGAPISMERLEIHRIGKPYVWIGSGYQPNEHRDPIPLFGGAPAPNFRHITSNGITLDWHKSQLSNLTTLDLRRLPLDVSPDIYRFRDILSSCPLLDKLTLDGAGPQPPSAFNTTAFPPIELGRLRVLVIGDFSLHYAVFIVSLFTAPHVVDLTLMNMSGEDYCPFFTAITSAYKEVRLMTAYTIEVVSTADSRRVMTKWLQSLPNLQYLRIAQINSTFFSAFTDTPDDDSIEETQVDTLTAAPVSDEQKKVLCPKLNILEYQQMDPEEILAWGNARKALGAPLKKIYVNKGWAPFISMDFSDLRTLCPIMIAPSNANTPDEERILAEAEAAIAEAAAAKKS